MHTGCVHVITLSAPVNLGKKGIVGAGEWIMTDLNAFEIAALARPVGEATVNKFVMAKKPAGEWEDIPDEADRAKRPILILRPGVIGDLLFLTPALRELKRTTGKKIVLCTWPYNFDQFLGCDFIDELTPYPLDASTAWRFSEIKDLWNTVEKDHENHATDSFAKALGLTIPLPDYRPFYRVTDEEKEASKKHLFKNRPTLVVQQVASSPARTYPLAQWLEVIVKLERAGWGILLMGLNGQYPPFPQQYSTPFIRDLSRPGIPFREAAAVLSQATAFVGVDSALIHLCHALDIPAVGLYGPFPWQLRTGKAPKTIAVSGVGGCAPCFYHSHNGRAVPPNKPCSARQQCVVLAGITPDRVVAKVSLLKP